MLSLAFNESEKSYYEDEKHSNYKNGNENKHEENKKEPLVLEGNKNHGNFSEEKNSKKVVLEEPQESKFM